MKILYLVGRFNGGAPMSMLEYVKIAENNGNQTIVCGKYDTNESKYSKFNLETIDIPFFKFNSPLTNIKIYRNVSNIIDSFKPDLIHATSYGVPIGKLCSKKHKIPILYSLAGGELKINYFEKDDNIIVYSKENIDRLTNVGIGLENIELISNRMSFQQTNDLEIYINKPSTIKFLLISRIDAGLFKSILNVIDIATRISETHKIELNILGGGSKSADLNEIIKDINKPNLDIIYHRHVDNVEEYINKSHLVFGKGRSIIQAVMANRVSFVISEDKKMALINPENFNNLYYFNFSGRNIENNFDENKLKVLIENIFNENNDLSYLQEVNDMIFKKYSIDNVKEDILNLYENVKDENVKTNFLFPIKYLMKIYIKRLGLYFKLSNIE